MVQSSPVPVTLTNPEPRPPTPPRESENSEAQLPAAGFFRRFFPLKDLSPRYSKPLTPTSSADQANPPSAFRKKVGWSELYEYKDPPITASNTILSGQSISPLRPSAERKATKSILKTYHGPDPVRVTTEATGAEDKESSSRPLMLDARMLESTVKQLAGQDRSSRLDAYTILSRALKVSDNVPDKKALSDKMGLILQFIRRDLTAKTTSGTTDIQLIKEALVLLSSFLHKKSIADTLTADFNNYLVDYALKTFEDPGMSKEIAKHLMFILAEQKFPPKVMTADRVGKLITALHKIEDFVQGKSIIEQRINIYRTLLRQSKSHVSFNTEWLQDLFSDMLSSHINVRSAAIAFGEEAALTLGADNKVSRAVMELLKASDGSDVRYAAYYADRLRKMAAKKPPGPAPQIWTVITLFFRARPQQFEQWFFAKSWLEVLQVCFNSSDINMRLAANIAWNRMVFVVRPDDKTTSGMIKTLGQPLIGQLRRKDVRKVSKAENVYRNSVLSSICNLLYYSLKPNVTWPQMDMFWDEYIVQLIGKGLVPTDMVENPGSAEQDLSDACTILQRLFDSNTQRAWVDARAMEESAITVSELPGLDPRWLRKSASRVFQILAPIIELSYWDFPVSTSKVTLLWRTWVSSMMSAASKEVKTSNDTMACLAFLFQTLYKIWNMGPNALHNSPSHTLVHADFFASFQVLVTIVISGLGVIPFTERLLSMGQQDSFIVVATPSHRPGKIKGEIRSPLHHLFLLLATSSPGATYGSSFMSMAQAIITPFFDARRLSKGKMDLVKDLIELLPTDGTKSCGLLWTILANFATAAINLQDENAPESHMHTDRPLGGEYRSIVKILDVGIDLSPNKPMEGWRSLFEALATSATTDAGDGGRAIVIIEPVAKALFAKEQANGQVTSHSAEYCQLLISQATYPKDRQALDAARRRLWGTTTAGPKIPAFDPYLHLYDYICRCLQQCYVEPLPNDTSFLCDVLSSVEALLDRCPEALRANALTRLQNGIALWVSDDDAKIHGGSPLSQTILSLWSKVCSLVAPADKNASKRLSELEPVICAGLGSKHASIANMAIEMWKTAFGSFEGNLQYPPKVKEALHRLLSVTDLPLPSFPESSENVISNDHRQPPVFLETQTEHSNIPNPIGLDKTPKKTARPHKNRLSKQRGRISSPRVIIEVDEPTSRKRSRETTPEPGKRKLRKKNSIVKLRHEDSQIQFEAIAGSSPASDMVYDSQLLTERQKEVRERQQAEAAAMFPDIRSSPPLNSKSTSKISNVEPELPSHRSSSQSRLQASVNGERQTTPDTRTFGDQDNFLVSSPTPARGTLVSKDIPPSSPPLLVTVVQCKSSPAIESSPPKLLMTEDKLHASRYKETEPFKDQPSPSEQFSSQNFFVPITSSDEYNVTSFPNDLTNQPVHRDPIQESLGPSAQLNPYAFNPGQTISTYRNTSQQSNMDMNMDTTVEFTSTEEQAREIYLQQEAERRRAGKAMDLQRAEVIAKESGLNSAADLPSTPRRSQRVKTAAQQAPNTPNDVYLDARTSPLSSDKIPADDDIFEDAISSPRLLAGRLQKDLEAQAPTGKPSSPLSELDESSFLRLAEKYDHVSSNSPTSASKGQKATTSRSEVLRRSPILPRAKNLSAKAAPASPTTVRPDVSNISPRQRQTPGRPVSQSSMARSMIPETPALENMLKISNALESGAAAEEDSDPESTIIVEVPEGYQQERPDTVRKRAGQFKTTPIKIKDEDWGMAKKRKIDEVPQTESDVPDSQEAQVEGRFEGSQLHPAKKRRGRLPMKQTQMSRLESSSVEIDRQPSPNVDSSSMENIKSARQQTANKAGQPSIFIASAKATPGPTMAQSTSTPQSARSNRASHRSKRLSQTGTLIGVVLGSGGLGESSSARIIMETSSSVASDKVEAFDPAGIEAVDETTIDGGGLEGHPSSSPAENLQGDIIEETLLQSQIAGEMEGESGAPANDQMEEKIAREGLEKPTYESVKNKLLSLVEDLGKTTLSRQEVNDIEDLFMDAKMKLYGAVKRGRQSEED